MIKLIDLLEAKQVGDIYHFTSINALYDMLLLSNTIILDSDFASHAAGGYYSFTRNPNLNFSTDVFNNIGGNYKSHARLKLDGDKMSHKYKFEPYVDVTSDEENSFVKNSESFEAEERISAKYGKIDLVPYILELQIVNPKTVMDFYPSGTPLRKEILKEYAKVIEWFTQHNIPIKYTDKSTAASTRVVDKHR